MEKRRENTLNNIFYLWLEWVVSTATFLAVIAVPLVVRPIWTPLVAVVMEMVLYSLIKRGRRNQHRLCLVTFFVTSRILFWSAIVMLIVLLLQHYLSASHVLVAGVNHDIPFIPVLITAPIGAVVCLVMLRRKSNYPFCVDCKLRFGTPAERGFTGALYSQEGTAQIRLFFFGTLLLTLADWPYYLFKYVNANLNSADHYFFFGIPVALWVLAALFMSLRYLGITRYYDQDIEGSMLRHGASTSVRYLIIGDNRLFISTPDPNDADAIVDLSHTKADTPARVTLPFRRELSEYEAARYLDSLMPVKNPEVRFLYTTSEWNVDCNIFLFVVNVNGDDMQRLTEAVKGSRWVTLREYNRLLHGGEVESLLASEIHRIYTTSMAFKTYDREGRRLY
ncbi:MAG: hypothetical protein K2O27_06835, partial [Candidatus Amulumruptor sp.]|nr:hypothetical protein [Candidatus Amulumruptor sp.]